MAAQQTRQWGVTPAVSTALPSPKELAANDALIAELKRENNFESAEETERRTTVLKSLQNVTVEFVRQVSKRKGLPQSAIESSGGKIFTYGSYRLGVYGPGSDIDTLVVVPRHVSRDDFFEYFPSLLESMASPGAIEELTPVPDAFVPIIKMEYSGISIDLIFARLAVAQVPTDLELKDKSLLRGVEERDLRCLNGTRVTDEILELVPQQKTFRHALRGIKLWAQRRAIYANVMGFPGGVAWAMLVARVCQLYPHATGSVIIGKFFRIMSKWAWPQPVLLKPIEDGPLQVRVWNPKVYNGDRFHLMPIITPAYPSMCATHNITMSTKKIIIRELDRAGDIADKILTGQVPWKELFGRHTFFTQDYKYYLSIVAASRSKEAQLLWSGLVESKVRLLVASLETVDSIELAHPFNKGYDRVHHCSNEDEIDKVLSGNLQFQEKETQTESTDLANDPRHIAAAQAGGSGLEPSVGNPDAERDDSEKHVIYTTTYYVGIELAEHAKKSLDISWQTKEFKDICTNWPQYNPDLNSLSIVHTRNYDLPDDVFLQGEKHPIRIKKPKAAKSNGTLVKKRSFAASDLEVRLYLLNY
ncbi:putative poly(A) polymerase pla1 [Xylona heveae TC161]|uniref:Poly(A) polymerase n=1 Tax=Xylona heveae (strain CBS 132557 / TC161) TaxID=1328760 RepID=A0A165HYM9_XYLHT|nr:putative poly(A) polymerase pla1 [Xylona heveae TC161]KZF24104.1 putative poly(A) polymerase pla1 [Xylona heveae TC161]